MSIGCSIINFLQTTIFIVIFFLCCIKIKSGEKMKLINEKALGKISGGIVCIFPSMRDRFYKNKLYLLSK